jgi:hypothetical protein
MERIVKFLMVFSFTILISSPLSAGNKVMVEKRIDELNRFSREAMNQSVTIPENGQINIKVRAIPAKDGFIFEPIADDENDEIETSSAVEPYLSKEDEEKFFSFREGIARIAHNKPRIVPYKNYGNEGEYISFKDAIIRLNRINMQQK